MTTPRTLLILSISFNLLLIVATFYFIVRTFHLSEQLVQASAIINETIKNQITDHEYRLRREQTRIHVTAQQITHLQIIETKNSSRISIADLAQRDGDNTCLYMYFSPNVCEACLYNEIGIQDSLYTQNRLNHNITILAPKYYIQNLQAKFQRLQASYNYAIVDYDSIPQNNILRLMNEPLLFRWKDKTAIDIFIPSKSNSKYSELYYNYLNE